MKILIGSKAAKHFFPDFPREPFDTDYIGTGEKLPRTEYHTIPAFDNYPHEIIQPDDLYTLKVSHAFWNIKWEKTIFDIDFLKSKGCALNKPLFETLYAHWITVHGATKRSNLNLSKEDFFDNAITCPHDHDYLHTLINPIPTYKKVLADGADVNVDENKFQALSHADKLELVREECYVMAYERLAGRDYRAAYKWMVKQMVLSHAILPEALFIIENYRQLQKPLFNYKKQLDYELSRNQIEA